MNQPHLTLAALYAGRTEIWGAVHGEAVRTPLREHEWIQHTHGKGSVGVYPLLPNGTVKWGAVDIDEGFDLIAIAANVWRALKALGVTTWVERSKGKGFHVILFATDWMPAGTMRNCLLVGCQVAGYQPKEIYPKQTSLEAGQVGNYLNAAYAHDWVMQGKRVVLNMHRTDRCPYSLAEWLPLAWQNRNAPIAVSSVAAKYIAPPALQPVVVNAYSGSLEPLVRKMSGLAFTMFTKGPLPDLSTGRIDRSSGVLKMAYLLRDSGFSPSEAMALLEEYDRAFGKFSERPDGALQMDKIIRRAFG